MTQASNQGWAATVQRGITGFLALSAAASGLRVGPSTQAAAGSLERDDFATAAPRVTRGLLDAPRPEVPACTASKCFNATRCAALPKVFVYPQSQPRLDRDDGASHYGYLPREPDPSNPLYTDNPDEACLFAVYMWSVHHDYAELPALPHWNGGQNHILIDFTDPAFGPGAPGDVIGEAMLAKSYLTHDLLRPGFDMSVPLLKLSRTEANVRAIAESGLFHHDARKHFLTFKGSTYREGTAGSYRWNLENIGAGHENDDVTIRLQCFKLHGWHLQEAHRDRCKRMDEAYEEADYLDLANTTFALVPGGRQPSSYRLTEALGAASIPVFVNPDVTWVKPYAHVIDWDSISLTFRPGEEAQILPTLRQLAPEAIVHMRQGVRHVYQTHLGSPSEMAEHLYHNALAQVSHRHHPHIHHGRRPMAD